MIVRSTQEIADLCGLRKWQVQRLYETRALPEPSRIAGARAIDENAVPMILKLARERGWLPPVEVEPGINGEPE